MELNHGTSEPASSESTGECSVTVIFREITEDGDPYYVAECLDLPGCVSQGSTRGEAQHNIQDVMQSYLSVIFEDAV